MNLKMTTVAALLALAAGHAAAQSSVRIYGIVDLGLAWGKGSTGKREQLSSGNLVPARLGFAGSEDLGGGLKANFALEAGLNPDTGAGSATNTNNQASGAGGGSSGGLTFNRQSWVGLQSGQWGELRLGRNFTPTFRMHVYYDPFNGGGVPGSQAAFGGIAAYGNPGGLRSSNAIEYWSPKVGGFSAHAMHALGENPSGSGATEDDGTFTGLNVRWSDGPLDLGVAYGRYGLAAQGDVKETVLGGKYNFGGAAVHAMYTRTTTGTAGAMDGYLLGASYRTGPYEFRGTYSTSDREDAAGAGTGSTRKIALAAQYHFSKRTSTYLIFARNTNSDGASYIPWSGMAPNGPNGTARVVSVGVVHSF